jgi:hypothetical protein
MFRPAWQAQRRKLTIDRACWWGRRGWRGYWDTGVFLQRGDILKTHTAKANNVTMLEELGGEQWIIVDLAAIATGQVLYIMSISLAQDLGVAARNRSIIDGDIAFGAAPNSYDWAI